MDELKPENEKIKLTDDQKVRIREEMAKCENPEVARIRRRELAEETGATIKQISAVSAYKIGPTGLDLRPQFPKNTQTSEAIIPPAALAETTPQVEEMYDNLTKKAWREKIRDVIRSDFTAEELQNAHVVCLPGQALQEVTDIYVPLGIQPQNILCIERNPKVAATMRKNAEALKHPVQVFEGSVEEFLHSPHQPVTIASFDFLGQLHQSFLNGLQFLRTADKFMLITNFLQKREKKSEQRGLRVSSSIYRTLQEQARAGEKPKFGEDLKKGWKGKTFEENVAEVVSQREHIPLSDARDEGMIGILRMCLDPNLYVRPLDKLYAEVGALTPPLGTDDHHDFMYKTGVNIRTIFKSTFEQYPELLKKVSGEYLTPEEEPVKSYTELSKRSFVELIAPMMSLCMLRRQPSDIQRYKYASESAGSPYQTDVLVQYDMENGLRREHRAAYDFTREFFRVLGQYGKDAISIRLERFAKPLPKNYSGSTVAIAVSLRVNGSTRARVSLKNLAQLVEYGFVVKNTHFKKFSGEHFEQPRVEIKAP